MKTQYIDLGLPSGRLWATENASIDDNTIDGKTYFNFNEAVKTFGNMLPSEKAWKELFNQCSRKWNKRRKGWVLTGPNGKTLFLPADGFLYWIDGISGYYWSSTRSSRKYARSVYFSDFDVHPLYNSHRLDRYSVRLCKPAGAQ